MIMKPYKYIHADEGYCCERDDGPRSSFKKKTHRSKKRADRQIAKKEINNEFQGLKPRRKA